MNRYCLLLAALVWASVAAGQHNEHDPRALATNPLDVGAQIAPGLPGLGDNHFPITSRRKSALSSRRSRSATGKTPRTSRRRTTQPTPTSA